MNADLAHALVDRIYAAASEPERWQDFVEDLSEALGGPAIVLVLQLPGFATPARFFRAHLRPMPLRVLDSVCQNRQLLVPGANSAIQAGFTPMDELLSVDDLANSEFCAEWMEPQGLLPLGGIGYCFASEDQAPTATIMIFERRGSRALGPADRALCDLLAPHLVCAYRLHRRMGGGQHERMALAGVMDRLPIGLVLLDRELRPVVTNCAANRILALDDGLSLGPDGLRVANARDDTVMQRMLGEFVEGKRSSEDGERVMAVSRPSGKRAYPFLIGMLGAAAMGDAAEDAVISLIFGDPETGQGITPAALRSAYNLTVAESELVGMLAAGYSLADAAENRGVSVNTVRTQLKHVFAKTETNRQGELIRLVLTGSASFPRSGSD
jgi:DNA-binding CsgD family transcriptional regulator